MTLTIISIEGDILNEKENNYLFSEGEVLIDSEIDIQAGHTLEIDYMPRITLSKADQISSQ